MTPVGQLPSRSLETTPVGYLPSRSLETTPVGYLHSRSLETTPVCQLHSQSRNDTRGSTALSQPRDDLRGLETTSAEPPQLGPGYPEMDRCPFVGTDTRETYDDSAHVHQHEWPVDFSQPMETQAYSSHAGGLTWWQGCAAHETVSFSGGSAGIVAGRATDGKIISLNPLDPYTVPTAITGIINVCIQCMTVMLLPAVVRTHHEVCDLARGIGENTMSAVAQTLAPGPRLYRLPLHGSCTSCAH